MSRRRFRIGISVLRIDVAVVINFLIQLIAVVRPYVPHIGRRISRRVVIKGLEAALLRTLDDLSAPVNAAGTEVIAHSEVRTVGADIDGRTLGTSLADLEILASALRIDEIGIRSAQRKVGRPIRMYRAQVELRDPDGAYGGRFDDAL